MAEPTHRVLSTAECLKSLKTHRWGGKTEKKKKEDHFSSPPARPDPGAAPQAPVGSLKCVEGQTGQTGAGK